MTPPAPTELIRVFRDQVSDALIDLHSLQADCQRANPKRMTDKQAQSLFDETDSKLEILFAVIEPVMAWLQKLASGEMDLGELRLLIDTECEAAKATLAAETALKAQREREALEGELLPRRAWEAFATRLLQGLGNWCDALPDNVEAAINDSLTRATGDTAAVVAEGLHQLLRTKRDQLAEELKQPVLEME